MTELGKAYVQIVPSADGIKGAAKKILDPEFENAGNDAGNSFAKKFCNVALKAISALGLGKLISESLNQGGQLEQSLGGVETMFKDSAGKMKQYASQAFQTTGLSANEYMQNVTSFSAALIESTGKSTDKAAEIANMAMIDMSDNANKMGTDMGAIQSAYQGFAKQNYTMLDNLKLGYGGTKTEMEKLLKDAQALTGVEYNIDNLADVYEAIHAIQKEMDISGYSTDQLRTKLQDMSLTEDELSKVAADMGISYDEALQKMNNGTLTVKDAQALLGTTAREAATTLEGSFNSMKAAWKDLLGQMALGGDLTTALDNLTGTVSTWLFGNFLPMVGNTLTQIPTLIVGAVKSIALYANEIIFAGVDMIANLITGIITAIPELLAAAVQLCESLWNAITSFDWESVGTEIMSVFNGGVFDEIPTILGTMVELLTTMVTTILDHLPDFFTEGVEIITSMISGITNSLPNILSAIQNVLAQMISYILSHLPDFLQKGFELIASMITGIMNNLPNIISAIVDVLVKMVATIMDSMPQFLQKGIELITNLISGISKMLPEIVSTVFTVITNLLSTLVSNMPQFLAKGSEIISSMINGILNNLPSIITSILTVITSLVSQIITHLPEFLSAGVQLIGQLAVGLIQAIPQIRGAIPSIISAAVSAFTSFDWWSVGGNIISGIVNGLVSYGGQIASTLMSIAKSAFDSVLSFFGIHSPSTLFRDMVGENIAKGWAEGLEDNANYVTHAMDDMAMESAEIPVMPSLVSATPASAYSNTKNTTNMGGVVINVNASDYDDPQALAEYIKDYLTNDIIRQQEVFA